MLSFCGQTPAESIHLRLENAYHLIYIVSYDIKLIKADLFTCSSNKVTKSNITTCFTKHIIIHIATIFVGMTICTVLSQNIDAVRFL